MLSVLVSMLPKGGSLFEMLPETTNYKHGILGTYLRQ